MPYLVLALLLLGLVPGTAFSQMRRPSDERPELKEFAPEEAPAPALRLPPVLVPPSGQRPSAGPRMLVQAVHVVGSTVFPDEELAALTAPYVGREIGATELIELRDAITRHYIANGYVNSGATIGGVQSEDGVVEIRVIEGTLTGVAVEGTEHFRKGYFESRLERAAGTPLNIHDLERRMQLLQQDARIRRLSAELGPGELRGESFLHLEVAEERRYRVWLSAANDESPSIGSAHGRILAEHLNLTGNGDTLSVGFGATEGLDQWDVNYALPLNASDTTLGLLFQRSDSDVVESPFDDLDITSRSTTYGIGLKHPVYRSPQTELWVGLAGELRRSETKLLSERFSFSLGADNGKTRLSVLRLSQEWTSRTQSRVIAARSTASFGLDIFNATDESVPGANVRVPDGTFFSWLGQFQWAERLPERYRGSELIFRTDLQLTNGPLLPMEQMTVGGSRTVRGYRENTMVRDNGLVSSIELRIPVLRTALGADVLQIAPFADFGHAWNDQKTPSVRTISSLGLGFRYRVSQQVFVQAYWGGRLRSVKRGTNLQDYGFHLQAVVLAF